MRTPSSGPGIRLLASRRGSALSPSTAAAIPPLPLHRLPCRSCLLSMYPDPRPHRTCEAVPFATALLLLQHPSFGGSVCSRRSSHEGPSGDAPSAFRQRVSGSPSGPLDPSGFASLLAYSRRRHMPRCPFVNVQVRNGNGPFLKSITGRESRRNRSPPSCPPLRTRTFRFGSTGPCRP